MKLVCGLNLFASHPFEIALQKISEIGFKYVDLWASPAQCNHLAPETTDTNLVKRLLKEYDLTPVSLTIYLTTDKEKEARMRLASELEIPVVIWEPAPSVDWHDNMKLGEKAIPFGSPTATFNDYVDSLNKYLRIGERLGVKLGLEIPHCYTHSEHLHQVWKLQQAIQDPWLEYVVAPTHSLARGYTAKDVVKTVGPDKTYMVYLWDVKKGFTYPESDRAFGAGEQQLPGGGQLDFKELISGIDELGFTGWYNIKSHGTEGWTDLDRVTAHVKQSYDLISGILRPNAV